MTFESMTEALDRGAFVQSFLKVPSATGLADNLRTQFILMPTPFPKEFWIAYYDKKPVATIGVSLSPTRGGTAYVGFFECDLSALDVAQALIKKAIEWAKDRGATEVIGPINFSTWFHYRYQVGSPDKSYRWEPVNPAAYPTTWKKAGFETVETYQTQAFAGIGHFIETVKPSFEKATKRDFRFRTFSENEVLTKDVPVLHKLSLACFQTAYLFEPIDLETFRALYVPVAEKRFSSQLAWIALSPEGEEIGFVFGFIDDGLYVIKTLAVHPSFQGHGVSNALCYLGALEAQKLGATGYVTALVRSGNRSESLTKKCPLVWAHEYELYRKSLK